MARHALAAIAAALLVSCATVPHESHTAKKSATKSNRFSFCEAAEQMTWAAGDTVETRDEIRAFKSDAKQHCPEGPPNGQH